MSENAQVTLSRLRLTRDGRTWLTYLLFGFYGALIDGLGPSLAGLRTDLGLSHAAASLHSSMFAIGMLAAGLTGDRVIKRLGRLGTLWLAATGMTAGTFIFVLGRVEPITLLGALAMGTLGSFLTVLVPAILSDLHGSARSAAFSEASSVSSAGGALAPILIGVSLFAGLGWRPGLLAATALVLPALAIGSRAVTIPEPQQGRHSPTGRLTRTYWTYWVTLFFAGSAEFCMVYWSSDFLHTVFAVPPAFAASAVTLFLIGMIAGRLGVGQLALRSSPGRLLPGALAAAAGGFLCSG